MGSVIPLSALVFDVEMNICKVVAVLGLILASTQVGNVSGCRAADDPARLRDIHWLNKMTMCSLQLTSQAIQKGWTNDKLTTEMMSKCSAQGFGSANSHKTSVIGLIFGITAKILRECDNLMLGL